MTLPEIPVGTPVLVGDRLVGMPELKPGDRLVAVHRTGDLLVVPAPEYEAARVAVERAQGAFRALAGVDDGAITRFFERFADRLADDFVWGGIAEANLQDVERAKAAGRSTTRLIASEKTRDGMIAGLRAWAAAPARRGEVIERREMADWSVERRRAPLGVVAFVFEGRPNVFADGCGVLRNGNAAVMRIGSDALGTAEAIQEQALEPALSDAGLPAGAVELVRSRSHAAAHALFTMPEVRLAIARGSGAAVALLGSIAEQHGIPASLHGTGGAWLYLDDDAEAETVRNVVVASLDRKVCNTLNVVAPSKDFVSPELFERKVVVRRATGESIEPQAEVIPVSELGREWEWEATPEVSLVVVRDMDEACELANRYSPRFVASIVTAPVGRFELFYEKVDVPYVGNGLTRWVDGQWAWGRPELGLTNWERGRLLGRSGILAGDDVFTVRDVFTDRTGQGPQSR